MSTPREHIERRFRNRERQRFGKVADRFDHYRIYPLAPAEPTELDRDFERAHRRYANVILMTPAANPR